MINLIDDIIKGENIDIQGPDEEINYSGLKKLNEQEILNK